MVLDQPDLVGPEIEVGRQSREPDEQNDVQPAESRSRASALARIGGTEVRHPFSLLLSEARTNETEVFVQDGDRLRGSGQTILGDRMRPCGANAQVVEATIAWTFRHPQSDDRDRTTRVLRNQ